ncbi:MAG: hypothetical protein A4E20_01485 [Nitrospira sp. SG-bin2]|uniref:hypothetical protein n=1 Tax=Nitrospira cf. moscoviensis SBR1015 TaxID=96242 RepID=UPI000A0E1275|nr:hypothetical protein [Nitrospira cf. moscoviensis SBR1015]OQW34877.1 MAG: hypothetical protein A4E20_01485 [Nitrospira sp. SG-bin2]
MKSVLATFLLLFALSIADQSFALTATVSGTQVTLDYTEPSVNSDAAKTPLVDLAKTTAYYLFPGAAAKVACGEKTASSPTGGQPRQILCLVPVSTGQEADVKFTVTATDLSGNEGPESIPVIKRIDKLAPGAPQ